MNMSSTPLHSLRTIDPLQTAPQESSARADTVSGFLYVLLLPCLFASGCGWFSPGPVGSEQFPTLREAQRPITEATQSVNLPVQEAWVMLLQVFRERNVGIVTQNEQGYVLTSDWVPMSDSLCGTFPSERAPLPCKTQYTAELKAISPVATSLKIRYLEECTERTEFVLECPGSNAEAMMLSLVEEFRARAGVVDVGDF